jgi:hypothetical protein
METSVASMALGVCGLGVTWQVATQYLLAGQEVKIIADVSRPSHVSNRGERPYKMWESVAFAAHIS